MNKNFSKTKLSPRKITGIKLGEMISLIIEGEKNTKRTMPEVFR
jgi:hypothetical protein